MKRYDTAHQRPDSLLYIFVNKQMSRQLWTVILKWSNNILKLSEVLRLRKHQSEMRNTPMKFQCCSVSLFKIRNFLFNTLVMCGISRFCLKSHEHIRSRTHEVRWIIFPVQRFKTERSIFVREETRFLQVKRYFRIIYLWHCIFFRWRGKIVWAKYFFPFPYVCYWSILCWRIYIWIMFSERWWMARAVASFWSGRSVYFHWATNKFDCY